MTSTPQTDACPTDKHGYVPVEFARGLEREYNRLRAVLREIADEDYRGHRSPAAVKAHTALTTL